jgi:hypothetical protein
MGQGWTRIHTDLELESDLTRAVIGSAFETSRVLGAGFREKVYERALLREETQGGMERVLY